jgi:Cellulase (glycosyl hydrolase family 5)
LTHPLLSLRTSFISRAGARRARRPPLATGGLLLVLALALAGCLVQPLGAERAYAFGVPLRTGLDASPAGGRYGEVTLAHVRAVGAQFVRLTVDWKEVAPASPPPGFNPANPDDPSYNWREVDRAVAETVAYGLTPFIDLENPPVWGESPPGIGGESPDPSQLALFAHAVAERYDGSRAGLPWVRYWEVWNEPNASYFLLPQLQEGQAVSVDNYRTMVNDVAAAVHGVNPENFVVGGALFPNGINRAGVTAIAPLEFTRRLFCLSAGAHPRQVCQTQVNVDAWSVHPYTSGGPSTRPANPDNVWISDLQSLTKLVQAAQRLGTLVSAHPAQTWVTEFSWDSNPPDPEGVPIALEQRWVAETLYRSWRAGVSVFSWYALRDEPLGISIFQSGLYFECAQGIECDTPKPAGESFRFPFVAYTAPKRRVLVWGRTPAGLPGTVRVQWLDGRRWRALGTLTTDSDGIFTASPLLPRGANPRSALLRAVRVGGGASPAFSLNRPPDILVTPFGS